LAKGETEQSNTGCGTGATERTTGREILALNAAARWQVFSHKRLCPSRQQSGRAAEMTGDTSVRLVPLAAR
jgi:hypothetical protein